MLKMFIAPIKAMGREEKKNLLFLTLAYFFALMSYSIIRSSSDAFFIQLQGAKNWPWASFYSVITLSLCVFIFSKIQKKIGVKKLYIGVSIFSAIYFCSSAFALKAELKAFSYMIYIWKECYSVILVHFCLAFFNTHFSYDLARSLLGPFAAIASTGPIVGGLLVSFATRHIGIFWLVLIGVMFCLITSLCFAMLTEQPASTRVERRLETTPLASVKGLWPYLTGIIGTIIITQFVINVLSFRFNLMVQENFASMVDKTVFFGRVYTIINVATLFILSILTPLALKNTSLRTNHFTVVGIYLVGILPVIFFQGHLLGAMATVFIASKAIDYSFFGTIKEMLYYPLNEYQKYGAKYIVDMVMYRGSKGLVSLFLAYVQNFRVLNILLALACLFWLAIVVHLFRLREKLLCNAR